MNVYKPKQLADKLKVSKETLRLWAESGKIKVTKTDGGHRRYVYNDDTDKKETKLKFIYTRVSSKKQQSDLERQIKYLQKLYPDHRVISDIGSGKIFLKQIFSIKNKISIDILFFSGLNFNRKGLNNLLEAIVTGTVEEVVVAHKDRLCRFGFELIENLCKYFSTTLTIVDDKGGKSQTDELAEDLLSIITVFTARFYGQRKYSGKKRGGNIIRHKKVQNISKSKSKTFVQ